MTGFYQRFKADSGHKVFYQKFCCIMALRIV